MTSSYPNIAVLIVTYGDRWKFLSQVLSSVIAEPAITKVVIVDNGSKNQDVILQGISPYGDRIVILRQEKNRGSAGGFAAGLEYVRTLNCDFVLMLDDDNVPEKNAVATFIAHYEALGKGKVVLVGNRINIPGNEDVFYRDYVEDQQTKGTFFEVFSMVKMKHFLNLLKKHELHEVPSYKKPHAFVPNESFVYGGSFIPIEAVRQAPLPDKELILYGDDIEYSWGIKRLGYESYVCYTPKIYDLEMSFGEASQVAGLLDPKTPYFKLYFRIRNMVRISVRNSRQMQFFLFINIFIWVAGLLFIGGARYKITKDYFRRVKLAVQAVWAGYVHRTKVPTIAELP